MMNYLGYRVGDADTAFGRFFDPKMAPLPRHVVTALEHGPQAAPTLLDFDSAATLLEAGPQQTENGYGTTARRRHPGVGAHGHARCHAGDVGLVVRLARQ